MIINIEILGAFILVSDMYDRYVLNIFKKKNK